MYGSPGRGYWQKGKVMDITALVEIFERSKRNCLFYESKGKKVSLLNEIGVLRGVAYCMEALTGYIPVEDKEFMRLIAIQNEAKTQEG